MPMQVVNSERDVIAMLIRMAQDRPIPAPKEETSPLYKMLVRKIRQQLREADPRMDFVEVELTARRMAGWVEELSKEAAKKSLSNIQARKVISKDNDVQVEEDVNKENILLEELPKDSSISLKRTGEKVHVIDEDGSKVLVEGIVSNDSEKTLVTKQTPNGDLSTWIVQVASKNPIKSEEETEMKNIQDTIKMAKEKMTETEWKMFVKNFIRKSDLKKNLNNFNPESLSAAEIRSALLPILKKISSELKDRDIDKDEANTSTKDSSKTQSTKDSTITQSTKDATKTQSTKDSPKTQNTTALSSKRESRPTSTKPRTSITRRDATPSFHNRVVK